MTAQFAPSIVRIFSRDGGIAGGGCFIADRRVLTCAHVVETALGPLVNTMDVPQDEITLDFPLLGPSRRLTARVVVWQSDDDIAGLEITGPVPRGARPVHLMRVDDVWGHTFRSFGFPASIDSGVFASGVLRDRQASGWVQIEDIREPGYRVQRGFSGSPVWDDTLEGPVGIVVAAEMQSDIKAAFMIPAEALHKAWPSVVPIRHISKYTLLWSGMIGIASQAFGIWLASQIAPMMVTFSTIVLWALPITAIVSLVSSLLASLGAYRSKRDHLTAASMGVVLLLISWIVAQIGA